MVKRLHIPMDEGEFEKVQKVKDELDLTWEEFVIEAAECLQEREREDG